MIVDSVKSHPIKKSVDEELAVDAAHKQVPLARQHMTQRDFYRLTELKQARSAQLNISFTPESLAVEAAIAIVINGIHYAVLMASPSDLEYLAIGFLFSEGLIEHSHDLLDWEITQLTPSSSLQDFTSRSFDEPATFAALVQQLQYYDAYVVQLTLSQRRHQRIQAQRRQLAGRTGCGMCGITGLKQALPDLSAYQHDFASKPNLDELLRLRDQITKAQQTHQLTGAVHAAATLYKDELQIFEDVGRHNALDKLIGWQLCHQAELDCVVMTSRLSIELVQKAVRCQLPWLVGMSAPTSTAVRVAQQYGLGLAGFLRDNRVTYYSGSFVPREL